MTPIDETRGSQPSDDDRDRAALERLSAELAGLRPIDPGAGLRRRVAAELARSGAGAAVRAPARRPSSLGVIGERLAWATAGAVAASVAFLLAGASQPVREPVTVTAVESSEPRPPRVREEAIGWSDEGIRFVDQFTPARVLRRTVIERHLAGDGAAEVRVPREDLIFLPVALR